MNAIKRGPFPTILLLIEHRNLSQGESNFPLLYKEFLLLLKGRTLLQLNIQLHEKEGLS
jgi:hypothetical protein